MDWPECMAQAVEHAIYQGWTEVKTAQLALPQVKSGYSHGQIDPGNGTAVCHLL